MGAGAVAVAAAMEATKASGAIVQVPPEEFRKLVEMNPDGVLVHAMGGLFYSKHRYLMGYKGLVFHTSTSEPVSVPRGCLVVEAKKIWIPG
jgi:hypothetical protein